jgi:hypothetical protein
MHVRSASVAYVKNVSTFLSASIQEAELRDVHVAMPLAASSSRFSLTLDELSTDVFLLYSIPTFFLSYIGVGGLICHAHRYR